MAEVRCEERPFLTDILPDRGFFNVAAAQRVSGFFSVRKNKDELCSSILVGTSDGNRPSDGKIEVFDGILVLSHARLCAILEG